MAKKSNFNKNSRREFKVPEEVARLIKFDIKKFKKKNKGLFDSKKELKLAYNEEIVDMLPQAISLIIRYGHLESVKEIKNNIYGKITEESFVKYLTKNIKKGLKFDNMNLLPNIIYDISKEAKREAELDKIENPDKETEYDLTDIIELSRLILKKKIKKLSASGIDENVAFDILSVIPSTDILKKAQYFHIRSLFAVLYEHSKTKEIAFEKVMKVVFKDDPQYINTVILFALLERKEKIINFTESQKKFFGDITEYCFKTMEDLNRDDIQKILENYVEARKRDESQNKDGNRRYYISSLPESDYPRILKAVQRICDKDENNKKYF